MTAVWDILTLKERDAKHDCGSCPQVHAGPYHAWCRAERERLHPQHFERWTETEHRTKRTSLTWAQQQTVWFHGDTWQAFFDGRISLEKAREILGEAELLPRVRVATVVEHMTAPAPKSEPIPPPPADFFEGVRPITPESMSEVEALFEQLRAEHPDTDAGELTAMIRELVA